MAHWPVVGRLIRIGVAVIRLPEFRDQQMNERNAWHAISLPPADAAPSDQHRHWEQFGSAQLPTLLQVISDLNHRQIAAENKQENLRVSAPVALRKLTRESSELRQQMAQFAAQLESTKADHQRAVTEARHESALLLSQLESAKAEHLRDLAEAKHQSALLLSHIETSAADHQRELAEAKQQTMSVAARLDHVAGDLAQMSAALGQFAAREQVAVLEQAVQGLRDQSEQLAASSAQAGSKADSVGDSIGFAIQRIEFVRRELMFELRYGAGAQGGNKALDTTAEILSHDKLEAARRDVLRLNLGCGHIALDGYINVDRRALPGVDIVAEVDALPLGPGEASEIFSSHLLEHFPEEQLRRQLLPYYNSLLKTGGVFRAVVPDAEAMIANYAEGNYPYEDMREVLYGSQDYDGDFHFNMFTPASLSQLLVEAGFEAPEVVESGRKNGRCYEFEIIAKKQAVAATAK